MTCSSKNGVLSILDETNNKTYNGSYKIASNSKQSTIYEIVLSDKSGTAVVSVTNYQDGTVISTMILSVGDYAINFKTK